MYKNTLKTSALLGAVILLIFAMMWLGITGNLSEAVLDNAIIQPAEPDIFDWDVYHEKRTASDSADYYNYLADITNRPITGLVIRDAQAKLAKEKTQVFSVKYMNSHTVTLANPDNANDYIICYVKLSDARKIHEGDTITVSGHVDANGAFRTAFVGSYYAPSKLK